MVKKASESRIFKHSAVRKQSGSGSRQSLEDTVTIPVSGRTHRESSPTEEQPVKSNYDWGPQKILNQLKADRLQRNRTQKAVYKNLVIHLSQTNRAVDMAKERSEILEV